MKSCSVCGETKPLETFLPDKRKRDGRASRCRECHREMNRQWREKNPSYLRDYYARNRDQMLAQQKAQREADPQAFRERRREAYVRSPEAQRARTREWYQSHRDESLTYTRAWHKANPQKVRDYKRKAESKRRARMKALPFEDVDPQRVFERDRGVCGICGESVDPAAWHLDHVIPLAQGGSHTYANVQTAHPFCNISKGGRGHER